jgi:hypothetical protein
LWTARAAFARARRRLLSIARAPPDGTLAPHIENQPPTTTTTTMSFLRQLERDYPGIVGILPE